MVVRVNVDTQHDRTRSRWSGGDLLGERADPRQAPDLAGGDLDLVVMALVDTYRQAAAAGARVDADSYSAIGVLLAATARPD